MSSNETRRRYDPDEKRRAILRSAEVGYAKASLELNIPWGTLSSWLFRARSSGQLALWQSVSQAVVSAPSSDLAAKGAPAAVVSPATIPSPDMPSKPSVGELSAPVGSGSVAPMPVISARARRRVAKVYTPSQIAKALERVAAIGVRPAAKELGVSRTTLREWERKTAKAAKGLGDSPTSGPDPSDVQAQRDAAILAEWKKQSGLGPSQVRNQLRRGGIRVSVQTVRRVMEGAGYRPPKVERRAHQGRYEAVRPGQLWHMDFLHRFVHGQKVFVLALIDDFSRFVTGWGLDDAERADEVVSAFEGAVARHGKPEAVMSDGGSAFWSWRGSSRFTRILEEYGVDQIIAENPELNGKSEVFNANLQKELFDRVMFNDVGDLRRQLGPHFQWYNQHRTHHALGGLLVPADRFYGRVDEVLARIESGGRPPDSPDLVLRTLDLFRVVSNRGKPEIWLMGHKLFDAKD